MTKLTTIISICAISAIAICAFVAETASAQTLYLCTTTAPTRPFADAHCKEQPGGPQKFGHVEITPNSSTPIILTNETTGGARSTAKLKSVQSGVTLELQATEIEGTGAVENKEEAGVMFGQGAGSLTFKNVTVTAPAGKGCKVPGGSITTKEFKGTTKGLTNQVKLESIGGTFAEFTIEGCSVGALNHTYSASGSLTGNTEGTTVNFSHAAITTQGTFSLFGQKAGVEFSLTTKDKTTGEGIALT